MSMFPCLSSEGPCCHALSWCLVFATSLLSHCWQFPHAYVSISVKPRPNCWQSPNAYISMAFKPRPMLPCLKLMPSYLPCLSCWMPIEGCLSSSLPVAMFILPKAHFVTSQAEGLGCHIFQALRPCCLVFQPKGLSFFVSWVQRSIFPCLRLKAHVAMSQSICSTMSQVYVNER